MATLHQMTVSTNGQSSNRNLKTASFDDEAQIAVLLLAVVGSFALGQSEIGRISKPGQQAFEIVTVGRVVMARSLSQFSDTNRGYCVCWSLLPTSIRPR